MPILAPVTSSTYENHFIDNSWASPQAQITAGYPLFIQPASVTSDYVETIDIGTLITTSVKVSLIYQAEEITAGATIVNTISLSADDITYDDEVDVDSVYASGFRYVKIKIEVDSDGVGLVRIISPKVTVGLKTRRDGGSGAALAADSGGTTVSFNRAFVDVESINVTPAYQVAQTKGVTAVYNFTDVANPTDFKVLLYSNDSGTRINGDFSWTAEGF